MVCIPVLQYSLWTQDLVSITNRSENVPKWYRTIRDNAKRTISHRVFENGEKLQNKSEPIGRNLLKEISIALLRIGEVNYLEMATTFVWDYYSSCRRYSNSLSFIIFIGLVSFQLPPMEHVSGMKYKIL